MTIFVPNTAISNTWDFWRRRSNQLSDAMSTRTVTVNSNATIGYAEVIGGVRANTVYVDILSGGNNVTNGAITVASSTTVANTLNVVGNISGQANVYSNNMISNSVITNAVTVGNTTFVTPNSVTSNSYFGNWTGNTIPVVRGGTGLLTPPPAGSILIGTGTNYTLGQITTGPYLSVNATSGSIVLTNLGCTTFASNNSNSRSGNVFLTSLDVTNALGYVPSNSGNSQITFTRVNADLQYVSGNVAIGTGGVINGTYSSNATLELRQTDGSLLPALFIANANTAANNQHSMINLGVANTGARMGVQFTRGANTANVVGSITYTSADLMVFKTSGADRVAIDTSGNMGIGTIAPSPNKGGNGLHVYGANPGLTLDTGTQVWALGVNPNSTILYGGVRKTGSLALYSDTLSSGIIFDASSTTSLNAIQTIVNGTVRVNLNTNGINYFYGAIRCDSDMFSTGYQTTSDYREKENIRDIPLDSALNRVRNIRPVSFTYLNSIRERDGFIAHELQESVPCAVTGVKDGVVRQTVDKSEVVPLLTRAIQALLNRVEDLELRLEQVGSA